MIGPQNAPAPTPQPSARATLQERAAALRAAADALRAIERRGGEVVSRPAGRKRRVAALDRFGGELERFDPDLVDALIAEGRLSVRRFESGGVVLGVGADRPAAARAGYVDG